MFLILKELSTTDEEVVQFSEWGEKKHLSGKISLFLLICCSEEHGFPKISYIGELELNVVMRPAWLQVFSPLKKTEICMLASSHLAAKGRRGFFVVFFLLLYVLTSSYLIWLFLHLLFVPVSAPGLQVRTHLFGLTWIHLPNTSPPVYGRSSKLLLPTIGRIEPSDRSFCAAADFFVLFPSTQLIWIEREKKSLDGFSDKALSCDYTVKYK